MKGGGTHSDQFKVLEVLVAAVAGTGEGLLDAEASCADAVGDVDYAGEFLELEEELATDGVMDGRGEGAADEDEAEEEQAGQGAESAGHGDDDLTCSLGLEGLGGSLIDG